MERIKLLALSDSPLLNTGFSTIMMNICNRLADMGYECWYLGQAIPHAQPLLMQSSKNVIKNWEINNNVNIPDIQVPSVYLQDGTPFKFNLIGQGMEPYCKDIIQPWIKRLQPDIYFTLLDTFMVYPWYLDMDFSPAKTVFYYPSDGEPFLPGNVCDAILKKMTKSVAMSKFGYNQVKNRHRLETEYVPHAIDANMFSPMMQKDKEILRAQWGLIGRWVMGCVSRNQPRKMLDRTLKAFAKFAQDKDDVVLMLHMDPFDRATAFDMNLLINELKIANKVIYTGVQYFLGFPYEKMREIYNLFDVFCLLTSGEGFGIPTIEAMACEVPVIITDYTTSYELIEENGRCGELVKLQGTESVPRDGQEIYTTVTGSWNIERGLADIIDAVNKLNKLYYDRDLCMTYGKTGRRKVLQYYTWDIVMKNWDSLFRKMLEE